MTLTYRVYFDPRQPRDRLGRWRDVLGGLGPDVSTADGTEEFFHGTGDGGVPLTIGRPEWDGQFFLTPDRKAAEHYANRHLNSRVENYRLAPGTRVWKPEGLDPIDYTPDRLVEIVREAKEKNVDAVELPQIGLVVLNHDAARKEPEPDDAAPPNTWTVTFRWLGQTRKREVWARNADEAEHVVRASWPSADVLTAEPFTGTPDEADPIARQSVTSDIIRAEMPMKWTRTEDGYRSGPFTIHDNGGGLGPAKGTGRWAVMLDGRWIANVDTLEEAKALARSERGDEMDGDWQAVLPEGYAPVKPPPLAASTAKAKWKREWFFMLRDLHEKGGYGWQEWGSGHQSSGITNALWKRRAIERAEAKGKRLLFRITPKGLGELMGFYEDWRGTEFEPPEPPAGAPAAPIAHEPDMTDEERHRLVVLRDDLAGARENIARFLEQQQDPEFGPFMDKDLLARYRRTEQRARAEIQEMLAELRYRRSTGQSRRSASA